MNAESANELEPEVRGKAEFPKGRDRGLTWLSYGAWGIICILIVAFYAWTVWPAVSQLNTPEPAQAYYNLLVQGFRTGHLSLAKKPSPELAHLANPYDPQANSPYHAHDLSYYHGRYYLYFGVTPALLLFWPYAVLTGHFLFHKHAVALFCAAGFLGAAGLFWAMRRRYFGEIGFGVALACVLALGLTTGIPMLLRRPDVWEVPIGCAYALLMIVFGLIWRALHSSRGAVWWTAAASFVYGLILGSRPSLLFGAVILLVPAGYAMTRKIGGADPRQRSRWVRLGVAAVAPITLIGIGLLLYNYLRFGDPFQFGQKYQLTWFKEYSLPHFGVKFLRYNLWLYFLQPVHWTCYFPFVEGIMPPPAPPGQLGVENPFGILVNVPFVLLALAAPLAWYKRSVEDRSILRWFLSGIVLSFATAALTVSFFAGACHRYEVDFLPALTLLAVCGMLGLERALAARRWWRWVVRAVWFALLCFSIGFSLSASCQFGNRLRTEAPEAYRILARWSDSPIYWVEQWRGEKFGPLKLKVKLPPFTTPHFEPLLVTGFGPHADYLYLCYQDSAHITVGFEHTSWGGPVSTLIPIDYRKEHIFVIESGSLYPPPEHPYFRNPDGAVTIARCTRMRVWLDGQVVLSGIIPVYDASPWSRYLGSNPFAPQFGRKFTGRILAHRILPPPALRELRQAGPVLMKVRFGERTAPGASEPLVVTGVPTRADLFYVRYPDARHVIFCLDHWGGGGPESAPFAIEPGKLYTLRVFMGSLYPAFAGLEPTDPRRRKFRVECEGQTVLSGDIDFYWTDSDHVYFGWNPVGGSSTGLRFSGSIEELRRIKESP